MGEGTCGVREEKGGERERSRGTGGGRCHYFGDREGKISDSVTATRE